MPQACTAAKNAAMEAVQRSEHGGSASPVSGVQKNEDPEEDAADTMRERAAPEELTPKEKLMWRKHERQRIKDLESARGFQASAVEKATVVERLQQARHRDFHSSMD